MTSNARVIAVACDRGHNFSKPLQPSITLVKNLGVKDDAHMGRTVQHIYDKKKNPNAPNLRQVHLMPGELFDELKPKGFEVLPGQMGENITTQGVDLLNLSQGAKLKIGNDAIIEITGLRTPCSKLNKLSPGLMKALIEKDVDGGPSFKAGVMAIVLEGGAISPGDMIRYLNPDAAFQKLKPV